MSTEGCYVSCAWCTPVASCSARQQMLTECCVRI